MAVMIRFPRQVYFVFTWLLFGNFICGLLGMNPGDMKSRFQQQFDSLFSLYVNKDPRIVGQVPFYVDLAKSAYHTGNMRVGIEALQTAINIDSLNEIEYVGMLCDLYYYLSRQNASVLSDVAGCLKQQYQLDKIGPNELIHSPSFWSSYSTIQQDLGKFSLAVAALSRARDASAVLNEGGRGEADPNTIRLLAKAAATAKDYEGALEVVESYMDKWKELAFASKMPTDVVADTWHDASLALWSMGKIDQAIHYAQTSLAIFPDIRTSHAENYHQTLARLYLEVDLLELTRASLFGIVAINFPQVPASAMARFGFENAAKIAKEEYGQTSADEVNLAALAMTSPLDPNMYFLLAQLSQQALAQWPQCTAYSKSRSEMRDRYKRTSNGEKGQGGKDGDERMEEEGEKESPKSLSNSGSDFSAVVVYLCCADEKEARDLEISVELWTKHVHAYFPSYPVLVVHDFLNKEQENKVASTSLAAFSSPPLDLTFAWLKPEDWHGEIPAGFDPSTMPIYRYGMGYRHMCRFFTGPLVNKVGQHVKADWILRIDTDSFILTPMLIDPFQHMAKGAYSYGWVQAFSDQEYFTTGLLDHVNAWLDDANTRPLLRDIGRSPATARASLNEWLSTVGGGSEGWQAVRMCLATNFFIIKTEWWESPAYRSFFKSLDESGGFYRYRWGDACTHLFAAAFLLDKKTEVAKFDDVMTYWHQGTVTTPRM